MWGGGCNSYLSKSVGNLAGLSNGILYFSIMDAPNYSAGVLPYIPFFYVIWSDDLLSASEIAVVTQSISTDSSLSDNDRKRLSNWLKREDPPSNKVLRDWKKLISDAGVKLIEREAFPLTDFSLRLTGKYYDKKGQEEPLQNIERNLGIQPNHYHHLFEVDVEQEQVSTYYDADKIDNFFTASRASAIMEFREEISQPLFQWEIIRDKEAHREKVLLQLAYLAKKGYGALAYPVTYGGKDDFPLYAAVFEHLMYADGSLAIKFGVQFGLFGGSIQKLGTEKHHKAYLEATGNGELLGCFAMTETMHGSNVRGIKTTATYNHDTGLITIDTPGKNDNKEYIGNALHAAMGSVFAQLIVGGQNRGVHALLVPLRGDRNREFPGITIIDNGYKLGLNGVDNGKLWFTQVQVPRENLLDRYGSITEEGEYHSEISNGNKRFFTMLGTLVGGRICVAKGALSGARMALAIAVKYALSRRQFNDATRVQEDLIMDYPTHQLRLTPPIAKTYVYQAALDRLIREYTNNDDSDRRRLETQVAGLKAEVTWFANRTVQECREACGGKGYLLENRIAGLRNDVDIFTTFEGDNTVLLQLAAKGVLSDFREEFNSDDFGSVLKLLGSQLGSRLSAINPLYTNKVDKDHLFNSKFHLHAFHYRTQRLTYTLAMRLRDYTRKGMSSHQAFLKVQTHLLALGKAYSTELAYTFFLEFTNGIKDEKYHLLMHKLGTLFSLHEIWQDAAWYQEHGYLASNKSKAIRSRVERLSTELRPHIAALVDGFGIPEKQLNVPLAELN